MISYKVGVRLSVRPSGCESRGADLNLDLSSDVTPTQLFIYEIYEATNHFIVGVGTEMAKSQGKGKL